MAFETCKKRESRFKLELRDSKWSTISQKALPIVIPDYIQSFRFEAALMKGAEYTNDYVTGSVRDFLFNPETIDKYVRKNLFDLDFKDIPLYKNQEGC